MRSNEKIKTEFNSAMSYNLNNAVVGEYPNVAIDYSEALVTRGGLATAVKFKAGSDLIGQLQVTWSDNSSELNANETDKAFILVYNELKKASVSYKTDATRAAGEALLNVPSNFQGDNVEVFISFISEDGKSVSNSKYAGSVTVMAE